MSDIRYKSLFSTPKLPDPAPATPLPNEEGIRDAERRRLAEQRRRGGERSTLLTGGGRETLGA